MGKEIELNQNVYIFATVGALILGGLGWFALGGAANAASSAVVGALAGGSLGIFF
jgi:hypothetical protein